MVSNLTLTNANYTGIQFQWNPSLGITGCIFAIILITLIIICIVSGNIIVIIVVFMDPKLQRQLQNWFIISLAIADLLVGLVIMPFSLTFEVMVKWAFGWIWCELWLALDVLLVTASIMNLCLISLDRYFSITHPIAYPTSRSPLRVLAMIGGVWLISLLISLPPVLGWRGTRQPGECSLSGDMGYILYSSIGSFYIPVCILVAVYTKIFMITRQRAKQQRYANRRRQQQLLFRTHVQRLTFQIGTPAPIDTTNQTNTSQQRNDMEPDTSEQQPFVRETQMNYLQARRVSPANSSTCSIGPELTTGKFSENLDSQNPADTQQSIIHLKSRALRKRELRATIVLGIVMAAFIGCWLPFFVVYLLSAFGLTANEGVFDVFFWLGYINSALNPPVYTMFNTDFRRAFKRLLLGKRGSHMVRNI